MRLRCRGPIPGQVRASGGLTRGVCRGRRGRDALGDEVSEHVLAATTVDAGATRLANSGHRVGAVVDDAIDLLTVGTCAETDDHEFTSLQLRTIINKSRGQCKDKEQTRRIP